MRYCMARIQLGDRVYVSFPSRGSPGRNGSGRLRFWGQVNTENQVPKTTLCTLCMYCTTNSAERTRPCAVTEPVSLLCPQNNLNRKIQIHCAEGYWAGVELDLPHGQVCSGARQGYLISTDRLPPCAG